ncbi:phage portal protein [Paenibacillus pinihumi]|uniref:phage portal protein n=1 Tax=Paenibacillus pinihumi TaxID=669462 RepID=UPI00040F26E7|nr:phage portal protein [Paenibacillus pinihumi]
MGIISKLVGGFNNSAEYSTDDFDEQVKRRIEQQVHSGVDVNEESAMRFITIYSCVRVLAETIGALPLVVYKERRSGKGADKAYDHPLYDLLYNQPNDEMTTVTWREQQIGNQAVAGNGYSVVTKNGRGAPVDLYPLPWHQVQPFRDTDGEIKYRIMDRGKQEVFPKSHVFHTMGISPDGLIGYSPIRMAAESIGVGMAATEFGARFYGQGMNVGSVFEYPNAMSDKAYSRVKEDLDLRGVGLANSWKPLILEEGAKFSRIPMPLNDAQFIETRKFSRDEICGLFRVPPHMIANMERSTFSNIEHQGIEFVKYTLLPYLVGWEKTISWKLLTPAERRAGYYAKFNVEGLLRGDYKSRQEGLAIQRQNGIINANKWREIEEMNPIEGEEGTAYMVNGNMIPTSRAINSGGGGENE